MIEIEDHIADDAQLLLLASETLTWDEAVTRAYQDQDEREERDFQAEREDERDADDFRISRWERMEMQRVYGPDWEELL